MVFIWGQISLFIFFILCLAELKTNCFFAQLWSVNEGEELADHWR